MSRIPPAGYLTSRTYPHASQLWLGVQQGITILSAEVDGNPSEGATSILLKNVVCDDFDDLVKGMTVSFGIPEVANRRVSAVFLDYDSGTQILTIGPNAENLVDDENVTIYSAMKLWRLEPPPFDGQKTPPFAITGSMRGGFVDEPIRFVGEFAYSPVGRAIDEYRWKVFEADVISGDVNDANTEAAPLVLSYPTIGEKLLKYRVTDSASERGIRFPPVLIFERYGENAPYGDFVFSAPKFVGGGWAMEVTVYGVADANLFPRQAQVVIWGEDYFGEAVLGESKFVGGQYVGAEEVVFTGWIKDNTTVVSQETNSTSFTLLSVEALMSNITMPSYTFRDTNAIPALELTPEALEEDTDNYAPTDFDGVGTLNVSATVPVNITGLTGGSDGRRLRIVNVGSETITLTDEDAGSAVTNQFDFASNEVLTPGASIIIYYDGSVEQWIVNDPAETTWTTFEDLTLDKCALHIIQQCTTLPLVADVFVAMFAMRQSILDVPSAVLGTQLQQSILQACFGYMAGSRFGSVTLARSRNMLTQEMRALLPIASYEFSIQDWLLLTLNGDATTAVAQAIVEGRLGDDTPVIGKYPASGPGGQGSILTKPGYVFFDQAQADEAAQILWRDGNRNIRGATMKLPNDRFLEPAFQEYATVILLAADNNRGYNWDNELNGETGRELVCSGMSMDLSEGAVQVSYEFLISVYGPHGRAWTPPEVMPPSQFVYGYGQVAVGTSDAGLLDSEMAVLVDEDGFALVDSDG